LDDAELQTFPDALVSAPRRKQSFTSVNKKEKILGKVVIISNG
jgi:hypothetical protein